MLPDNTHIVIVIENRRNRLYIGRAICPPKFLYYLLAYVTLYYRCQMRSRYQGACFDSHIHLFMYNIIAICFKMMIAYHTPILI